MDKKPMDVLSRKRDWTKENLTKNVKTLMKNSNKLRKYELTPTFLSTGEAKFGSTGTTPSGPKALARINLVVQY
jgi:hypothetical protein